MAKDRLEEALVLSEQILTHLELADIPLAQAYLKTARLARLLNQAENVQWATQQAEYYTETEGRIEAGRLRLQAAQDRDVSVTSANPQQYVFTPAGNFMERNQVEQHLVYHTKLIGTGRKNLYDYVLAMNYELRFSNVPRRIFEGTRLRVDAALAQMVPDAVKKFVSVFDNLKSKNSEDWSNAVHSCRRILSAVADELYPPNPNGATEVVTKGGKKVKVGPDHYINRLALYVEKNATSARYQDIVGSQLAYMGDRLEHIYSASTKGSHTEIASPAEAERYIIYTYLLIGDLLTLQTSKQLRCGVGD